MSTTGELKRLELEVQFGAQPIRGRVYDREGDDSSDRSFHGWLGLMSAIEAAGEPCAARPAQKGGRQ